MSKESFIEINEYPTTDLYFAAYLKAAGVKLLRVFRNDKRMHFVFENLGTSIEDLKLGWQNDDQHIRAQTYANAIRHLKSLCFQ